MADNQEMISQLLDGSSAPLPSESEIIKGYVSALHEQAIQESENAEEARNFYIEYYTSGPGAAGIKSMINDFKNNFAELKDGVDDLTVSIAQITASNAMPSVITSGAATSVPNPAHFAIENLQKKKAVQVQVRSLANVAAKIINSSDMLCLALPGGVSSLIESLASLKQALDAIPG